MISLLSKVDCDKTNKDTEEICGKGNPVGPFTESIFKYCQYY
jgi:hypothetical protein